MEWVKRHLDDLVEKVRSWDHEDARQLGRWLMVITQLCRTAELDVENEMRARGVDISDLPSEPVDENITGYPVWALDRHGRAVVDWNDQRAEIVPIGEIRDWMKGRV